MSKLDTLDLSDERLAIQEEERNLATIEHTIDSVISESTCRMEEIDQKLSGFYVYDHDDRENLQYYQETNIFLKNKVAQWKQYKDSPYYGRMDLVSDSSKTEVFFIGEKGISDGSNILVLDWRTPLGGAFTNKQATKYTIEGTDYKLLLRRSIDIKNAKVQSVNTEYDEVSLSIDGGVIDPFLLSVLRDKRRNYKLTDIIRTIQGNQNEIIRKPIDESFIVQGCAGSGKTMILFHRLSYIAFNHPEFNFARCCVITPNEVFNIHVDELSKKLGLDKIKRYSVEGYYSSWIKFLGKNDIVPSASSAGKPKLKIDPLPDKIVSENLLDNKMLEEIYSKQFYESIISLYYDHWDRITKQLNSCGIQDIFEEYSKPIPDLSNNNYPVFRDLDVNISAIKQAHSAAIKTYEESKANLAKNEIQLSKVKDQLTFTLKNLEDAKTTFLSDLISFEKELEVLVSETKKQKTEAEVLIEKSKKEKETLFKKLKSTEESLVAINNKKTSLNKPSFLRTSNLEIALILLESCSNEIQAYENAEIEYSKIAVYNFGRRSRARAEISKAEKALSVSIDTICQNYSKEYTSTTAELRQQISGLDRTISLENQKLANLEKVFLSEKKLDYIKLCISQFNSESLPDLEKKFSSAVLAHFPQSRNTYLAEFKEKNTYEKLLHVIENQITESKSAIEKDLKSIIRPETIETINKATDLIRQLDFSSFYSLLESKFASVYTKYDQKKTKGITYRHNLFYKLLLCSLYYENSSNSPFFICIDEAQDLSQTEYALLKRIHGPNTTYNLYGDVNQLVYSYKGINQWDEISEEITQNVCFLNENYRNTEQITNYCNKVFEADVFAIGLSGSEVKKLPFDEAVAEILRIHTETPSKRTAIIYRKGLSDIENKLSPVKDLAVFDDVILSKISVITVEESKGLEFDAVVVIDSMMTMNEKYISYTRALDNLIISDFPDSFADEDSENNNKTIKETKEEEPLVKETISDNKLSSREIAAGDKLIPSKTSYLALPDVPIDLLVQDAEPYIYSFFEIHPDSIPAFSLLANEISLRTPDIMIRVSKEYIGLAKSNEKCRVYVFYSDGNPHIKFKHLFSKYIFTRNNIDNYLKSYDQCCKYIEKYPNTIVRGSGVQNDN